MTLKTRMMISIDPDVDERLHLLAAEHRTPVTVVVRGLLDAALDLDPKKLSAPIEAQKSVDRQRRVEIGRAAMAKRYGDAATRKIVRSNTDGLKDGGNL